jgi:8-oxo-dGTP pyrophosphatase MutT (NUDIX family)
MNFDKLIQHLISAFDEPLPGAAAQMTMAPIPVDADRFQVLERPNARKGGVLILFYPNEQNTMMPLILRPQYDGTHGGQVSFPGGKCEENDNTVIDTALRESEEEIGIDRKDVTLLGKLSKLYIPPSNFSVEPIVGYTTKRPNFNIDPYEVERLLELPISKFIDPTYVKRKNLTPRNGVILDTPYFDIDNYVIWGATAMMLGELIEIIKRG